MMVWAPGLESAGGEWEWPGSAGGVVVLEVHEGAGSAGVGVAW